jgi:hypothetical protein
MTGLQAASQETYLSWSPIEQPGCAEREEILVATEWAAFTQACTVAPKIRAVQACLANAGPLDSRHREPR